MSHQNGYIYGPPPAPPPKATGPPPSFNSPQNNQFSRGNYGNRGRGNNRSGGRGNFNNRGGSNQGQGRGGYTNYGTHPPHGSPPQPLYPVAGAYQAPAAPPYPPPAHQAPSYPAAVPPSTFQSRPPHQASQYQPPPQAFGHQPPPPQSRPPYPQATGYNSVQTNSYPQTPNRWPRPNPVPPPPQHQTPTSTPQPIRFFPQQPPPPTSYSPSQPPHPSPAASFQPNQPYGKPPPPPPQLSAQPHTPYQNQGPRPHHSYADLRVDGRVRPPAPPSVPTFFGGPSSLPQPPPSLPPHPPPPSNFNQHVPNQQQRHNQHHNHNHNQHHGQHNRNRGNFGHRNNNGFNHDRRNKDRGHRGHHQNQSQQFQPPQNPDLDMSPEEYALWTAAGSKVKGTDISLQDPAEIEKWLEERKKKWPTAARVAERKAEDEEKQRLDQNEALKKKLDSLNQTESQLRKRKLDEVADDEDKSKQQSKKKKKKKKKKKPQDDAPVVFEENSAAADQEATAPDGEPDSVTVEEPTDDPPVELSESKLESEVADAEAVTLAALEEDFLAMDELVESGDAQQAELVTESFPEGEDDLIGDPSADQDQGDVIVEEPLDNAAESKDNEDKVTLEGDDDDSESVAMSTSSSTAESGGESAEDGSENESGSVEGSEESDEDAPPEESSTKPTGLPEKPPPAANPNKQKQVCKLWLKKNCRYGAKCKYLHEGGVPKTDKERREEKKQQKETKPKDLSLYDKLMQAQMEKENVKLLQAINFFVEKEILKV
ncbi:hypothetical protein TWF481_007472 [Arthrobotrys musiformis]|uniref:C3H1-type domain-containing protein n=1 Tax=Arthrobotrys musiformis TaxID=47236 RepID=A0AAV9WBK1_9PEZI